MKYIAKPVQHNLKWHYQYINSESRGALKRSRHCLWHVTSTSRGKTER
jgi:hypothetical protein